MQPARLDEAGAYRRLKQLASTKNRKMREVTHMILAVEEAFRMLR
jgi:AmiR/NasT family two-component response regulator